MRSFLDRFEKPSRALMGIWLLLQFVASTGCGSGTAMMRQQIDELDERIADLERTSGRWQVEFSQMEEKVLLLEDRVEAHRISLERQGSLARRSVDELPSYQPPGRQADYSFVDALPVERVLPPGQDEEPTGTPGVGGELVITNDSLDDFVNHGGGRLTMIPTSGTGNASPAGRSAPIADVVVGERLPVTTPLASRSNGEIEVRTSRPLDLYQDSLRLFNEGQYGPAVQGLLAFLDTNPAPDYQDNALFWIGECQYATAQYPQALATFQRVVDDYPDGNKIPDSLLKIGLTYERLNNLREASTVLQALVETYPLTEAARRASERLSELN